MSDHKEHLDEIAQMAAALHGQEWGKLPMWTRDRWREVVRHTTRGGGSDQMERHAGQAIDEWYKRQEVAEAPLPEKKSKKK